MAKLAPTSEIFDVGGNREHQHDQPDQAHAPHHPRRRPMSCIIRGTSNHSIARLARVSGRLADDVQHHRHRVNTLHSVDIVLKSCIAAPASLSAHHSACSAALPA